MKRICFALSLLLTSSALCQTNLVSLSNERIEIDKPYEETISSELSELIVPQPELMLAQQMSMPIVNIKKPSSGPSCGTQPTWKYKFVAKDQSPGAVTTGTTLTDSSGFGQTATVTTSGSPVLDSTTTPTPNGTQTLAGMNEDTGAQWSGLGVANNTDVGICAIYNVSSIDSDKATLTSTNVGGNTGGYGYFVSGNDNDPQGIDVTINFNMATAAATPPEDVWQSSCVSVVKNTSIVFYRSNGSGTGMNVDGPPNVNTTSPSFNGINVILSNWNGGSVGTNEGFRGAVEEIAIVDSSLSSSDVNNYAVCAKLHYNVN